MSDGRTISIPLAWFPRHLHVSAAERANHRPIGRGERIRWEAVDEDIIDVANFLDLVIPALAWSSAPDGAEAPGGCVQCSVAIVATVATFPLR